MSISSVTIKLSQQEIEYLGSANFLKPHQIGILKAAKLSGHTGITLKLSRDSAEELREAFTDELAKKGFDENYDLTPEGRILEDLIDRFYIECPS